MSTSRRHPELRPFLLLPFALLLAGIGFTAMSAGAAAGDETDIMAFDLP